jgi:hypothetical protein
LFHLSKIIRLKSCAKPVQAAISCFDNKFLQPRRHLPSRALRSTSHLPLNIHHRLYISGSIDKVHCLLPIAPSSWLTVVQKIWSCPPQSGPGQQPIRKTIHTYLTSTMSHIRSSKDTLQLLFRRMLLKMAPTTFSMMHHYPIDTSAS